MNERIVKSDRKSFQYILNIVKLLSGNKIANYYTPVQR